MQNSTAILLDGGFVLKRLYRLLGERHPTAKDVYTFAKRCLHPQEELFRIYYYDCPPFDSYVKHPLEPGRNKNFGSTDTARRMKSLQDELAISDSVAFRRGELLFQGWTIRSETLKNLVQAPRPLDMPDLKPDFIQKRVDMKIGLDVAWMASKRIVERLILVTADTDFIPAMKFARREGTQVILVPMGIKLRTSLREHADEVRNITINCP